MAFGAARGQSVTSGSTLVDVAKRPRYHLHFTPTYASWLNQVERWFALLTERQIRRAVHRSIKELEEAIAAFIANHNAAPQPFHWTKSADAILQSLARFCQRTLATHVTSKEPLVQHTRVGYSAVMERDEKGTFARLKAYRTEFLEPPTPQLGLAPGSPI